MAACTVQSSRPPVAAGDGLGAVSGAGVYVEQGSTLSSANTTASLTATSIPATALLVERGSIVSLAGPVTLSSSGSCAVIVTQRSSLTLSGATTVATSLANMAGIQVVWDSLFSLAGASLGVTCGSATGTIALTPQNGSFALLGGAAPVTMTGCGTNVWAVNHGAFFDYGSGAKPAGAVSADNLSIHVRGGFPVAGGSCTHGSTCR